MNLEEPNWFMRWEEELPSPDELTPLSQTLITPDLALALDLFTFRNSNTNQRLRSQNQHDSSEMAGCCGNSGGSGGEEQARTLKRPRLVWTPQLHKRFVDAVSHLGIKHAVPKTIMQLMNVDGLTRENVASHLQKYRLYLKRLQGISSGANSAVSRTDELLFANGPIPHHFIKHRPPTVINGAGPEPFLPVTSLPHPHRHQGSFRPLVNSTHGGFFLGQHAFQQQSELQRMVWPTPPTIVSVEDSGTCGGRRVLSLFPTNDG